MEKPALCIVGLGYVGLPLAHAFAMKQYPVYGFDISKKRIQELQQGRDVTEELTHAELAQAQITFSVDPQVISQTDIIILAIPTPVDSENRPDLSMLEAASRTVGENMRNGAIVVYESTVYPGVTEEVCGPILEKASGLTCGQDFTLGYSPERINPGSRRGAAHAADQNRTLANIVKVVGAQDKKTLRVLVELYASVVTAGVHPTSSIKVAEMAKAIENAQRDLNIAYINEVAMLCNRIGISTKEVIEAAGTKWNFLKFTPGLVGGHCIGVDPYYLVEKAKHFDMQTHVITAGRRVNDDMGHFVAEQIIASLGKAPAESHILVLGLTFKENMPDTRNSRSRDVIGHLHAAGCTVEVHDPYLSEETIRSMNLIPGSLHAPYDAVVLLVMHSEYLQNDGEFVLSATKEEGLVYDLKSVLDRENVERQGKRYMAL